MDLVVTTPGVATPRLREELDAHSDRTPLVDRATRCGATAADPMAADRLRVAVVACSVSLHAADRFRQRLEGSRQSVDGVILCRETVGPVMRALEDRFGCPVTGGPAGEEP